MVKEVAVKLSSSAHEMARAVEDKGVASTVSPSGGEGMRWTQSILNMHRLSGLILVEHVQVGMTEQYSPPGVSTGRIVEGPVPALFTATTDTVYCVDGVSPDIVACLASTLILAVPSSIPPELVAVTV